ncbi:hypothetical protein BV22DRAFT_1032581 [Leucogyrophana mollusca]|uniref:Uncharacterized protein n=1 Tax=Leucogyrophana mollusca TaxID=85980 RepID=A0ACB8BLE8_9AGAM|nr:hypothetical protein BV22DRAFT_1032581 [Leucogyrophana mollusca]
MPPDTFSSDKYYVNWVVHARWSVTSPLIPAPRCPYSKRRPQSFTCPLDEEAQNEACGPLKVRQWFVIFAMVITGFISRVQ